MSNIVNGLVNFIVAVELGIMIGMVLLILGGCL